LNNWTRGVDPGARGTIGVRAREFDQLMETFEPLCGGGSVVLERVERFIISQTRAVPRRALAGLVIELDVHGPGVSESARVERIIQGHFARRSGELRRELWVLLRRGAASLAIGVAFLSAFLALWQFAGPHLGDMPQATLMREGLLIFGWVAMWKPLEIFLYDWWPLVGERRLLDRLARMPVHVELGGKSTASAG